MATEHPGDQRAAPEREPPRDLRSSTPPPPPGPRIPNDGPESPRSNLC